MNIDFRTLARRMLGLGFLCLSVAIAQTPTRQTVAAANPSLQASAHGPDPRIVAQDRNENQSLYRIDDAQSSVASETPGHTRLSGAQGSSDMAAIIALFGAAILCGKRFVHALA